MILFIVVSKLFDRILNFHILLTFKETEMHAPASKSINNQ